MNENKNTSVKCLVWKSWAVKAKSILRRDTIQQRSQSRWKTM